MNIDIRTLILIICITHLIQGMVFYHEYRVNKAYNGPGWWLLWSTSEVIGFFSFLLRDIPSILPLVIIVQNSAIFAGTIFLYVGIMRFMDKKVNLKEILTVFVAYVAALLFFLFVNNDIQIRLAIVTMALASTAFYTAFNLFKFKDRTISSYVTFFVAILILHGSVFAYRFVVILSSGPPVADVFSPTFFNVITFIDALIVSLLWTFGFVIMINQRLNTEMREAKNDFEMIFNASPEAVLITNIDDGCILGINQGFTSVTGYTMEESIGKSSLDLLWKNKDERKFIINEILQKGFCKNFEAIFRRKDDTEMIALISSKVFVFKGINCIISITRDITEWQVKEKKIIELNESLEKKVGIRTKELQELTNEQAANQIALLNLVEDLNEKTDQLELSASRLQSVNKELEAFSYSVSHDLRAPLRHINGFIGLLTSQFPDSLPEEGKIYLNTIQDSARQMGLLIDDLLQFSRSGRQEMRKSLVDMNLVFREVLKTIVSETGSREIEWIIHNLPSAYCDHSLVKQVWINLLSNAVKFTQRKEDTIIEVGYEEKEKECLFFVRDNGVGFDMRYANKLYGVFQRLHSGAEFEGTGIGLANVQRIILRHGGRVWAEAEPDKGAIFYFTLPKQNEIKQ